MPEQRPEHSIFNLQSALLAVFKRKWLVIICALSGLLAAAAFWLFSPAIYASESKLLVRYVLDRSAVDSLDGGSAGSVRTSENVVSSEVEILNSWDLAVQTAEAIGAKRLLPELGDKATVDAAAGTISSGLEVIPRRDSNIIFVLYRNRHPELATVVLNELVNRYFIKHLEVHRSAGAFDFVSQQTDQVRARLNQTEDELKTLKAKAGVLSLNDSTATLSAEMVRVNDQLRVAESDLAEQQAQVKQMEESISMPGTASNAKKPGATASPAAPGATPATPSGKDVSEYQAIVGRLTQLRQTQLEMLTKYTSENVLVKMNQQHVDELEKEKHDLEVKYPELATKVIPGTSSSPQMDIATSRAHIVGVQARIAELRTRQASLQDRMKQLGDYGPRIADLERNKELEEANYKYFEGTLEKARVDEALDPSKMPNISLVQRPSPPGRVTKERNKISLFLAGGGVGLGLALALALELIFNRTVKQRTELEAMLRMPVMVSIPYDASGGRLQLKNGQQNGDATKPERAPWDPGHFMRTYSEAIRDRLGLYFELHGVTHKPKLIGVTGFGQGAGTSTLAAGIAAALSETGDGKVLLVDANAASGQAHPFFAGKPAASLTAAIEPAAPITSAADNLYLATVSRPNKNATQLGLRKFFSLVPNLKASDFDYIIFDMPPLTQTSPTIGLAALMDKVLLVVEAEKTNRDVVNRGYRELVGARADVAVVLNKTRSYGPDWLEEKHS